MICNDFNDDKTSDAPNGLHLGVMPTAVGFTWFVDLGIKRFKSSTIDGK